MNEQCARRSRRFHHMMGCIWFALLMGAPYPAWSGVRYVALPSGTVALSATYAWVALGCIVGLWVASHPTVKRFLVWKRPYVRIPLLCLLALSVVLVGSAWANTLYLMEAMGDWSAWVQRDMGGDVPAMLLTCAQGVVRYAAALAFIAAVGCGAFQCVEERADDVAVAADRSPHDASTDRVHGAALILSCMLGVLQPLAWVALLPHAGFPQNYGIAADHVDLWVAPAGAACVTLLVPTLATAAFYSWGCMAADAGCHGEDGSTARCPHMICLCAGILTFRLVSRAMPSLYEADRSVAYGALALYTVGFIACIVGFAATVRRAGQSRRALSIGSKAPRCKGADGEWSPDWTEDALHNVLTESGRSFLKGKRLSDREMLVACAQIVGLNAEKTGSILGIGESTVREYRRRCRVKLGMDPSDDIRLIVPEGSIAESENGSGGSASDSGAYERNARRRTIGARIGLCCLGTLGMLVLLPVGGAVHVWSDVWTSSFGMGIGLLAAWLVVRRRAGNPFPEEDGRGAVPGRVGGCFAVAGLAVSAAALLAYRMGMLAIVGDGVPPDAVLMAAFSVFTLCHAILSMRFFSMARAGCTGATDAAGVAVRPCGSRALAQLVVLMFVGWFWAELWRSQRYTTVLVPLAVGVAGIILIEIYRCGLQGAGRRRYLALVGVLGAFVFAVQDAGCALAVMLVVLLGLDGARRNRRPDVCSWHCGFVALAVGLIAGTLVTNAYGYRLLYVGIANRAAIRIEVMWVVGALLACAVAAYARESTCLARLEPGTGPHAAAESFLEYRGLSANQARIALYLAEGRSVRETANLMCYAESTVHTARSEIYDKLAVRSRAQLVELIQAQLGRVDARG